MANLRTKAENTKISLKYVIVPESKLVLKTNKQKLLWIQVCQRDIETR